MRSTPSSGSIPACSPSGGGIVQTVWMEAGMKSRSMLKTATALAALAFGVAAADARGITWARTGDALTLDPHAQNEGPTHNLNHQIYEPLLIRDHTGKIHP